MKRRFVAAIFIIMLIVPSRPALAEPPDEASAPNEKRSAEIVNGDNKEKQRIRAAQEHVKRLGMYIAADVDEPVEPVERPLLFYGDPARIANHGTLWAFGRRGRPVAFMELWQGSPRQAVWYQSLIRTGDQVLLLRSPDGRRWQPPGVAVARTKIDGAPRPADSEPARLRQLKMLARSFSAHEIGDPDNSRFELRLLVQPVHRYSDPKGGIQDGAAFIFAHGTNPELILLLEALGANVESAQWHYSAFPSSSAELHAEMDGRDVWTRPGAPRVVGGPNQDYWVFSLPLEAPDSDD